MTQDIAQARSTLKRLQRCLRDALAVCAVLEAHEAAQAALQEAKTNRIAEEAQR